MIIADKIIENRKKNGWSQEELAGKLGVSRQSVSKWEGAQAVPDMKKIVQMSDLFGVSTDYLLRDEIETVTPPEAVPVDSGLGEELARSVSMEAANAFLVHNEKAASRVSTGVMLCILSPVIMIVMTGLAGAEKIPMDEAFAGIGGLVVLLIMVAAAVGLFLKTMMSGKPFEYLENTNIDTEYGVSGMVRERCSDYAETHSRLLIIGIMLCVISAIPLVIMELAGYSNNTDVLPVVGVAALLVTVAIGVKMIVLTCIRQGGFDKLLEEGDYTRLSKKAGRYDGIYWAIALAVYLGWSFINNGWQYTWIVWPIAGVLHAAYKEIMKAFARKR
ncbi:helix-turn-helix domain-containing protein [Eubacterium pyruvativorans]|uniref:helix-turn-helix domain-containing protein n=1 Tax=Eubacterium pyruvativorans TaxID=155865 RepID=UPI003F8C10FB